MVNAAETNTLVRQKTADFSVVLGINQHFCAAFLQTLGNTACFLTSFLVILQ